MCGIAGFFDTGSGRKRAEMHGIAKSMAATLSHRGPDGSDIWQDPDVSLVLAHQRLSIIDLSDQGRQPMHSASERYVISYNGEIYNYPALKTELEGKKVKFKGGSDTEVLLGAIEQWGLKETLQKINGMFAFVLWDRKDRQLHFVRDPLGKKPLYIAWSGKTIIFASEVKALRAHPDFKPKLDQQALSLFLRYGYIPAPYSIYEDVVALPAGHRMSFCDDLVKLGPRVGVFTESYWNHLQVLNKSRTDMISSARSEASVIGEFEALLTTCVKDRMVSDVPLGAFLSGGIDSSTIVALMQKASDKPIKTYSVGFEEGGYDEAGFAKNIAKHLGTDHHELYITSKDAIAAVSQMPDIYDEPFADFSCIPTYLVSKFAKQGVTVALSGDGGDEMLGGYNRHFEGPRVWDRMHMIPKFARARVANFITSISKERWDALVPSRPQFGNAIHKAATVLNLDSQDEMYMRLISHWNNPPLKDPKSPRTFLTDPAWKSRNLSFAERMMYSDTLSYLPNDILVKLDRASMAVSLEARAPLLDKRIYEYVWRLPESYKIRGHQGKWLLRQVLERHVPQKLFHRPKQGFTMPIGQWLRGPMKEWAEHLLDEDRLKKQGIYDAKRIRETWSAHLKGQGNHTGQIWNVLMFQSWHDRWM
jgi:asparagine synthase (glutamine-hydrolysing)